LARSTQPLVIQAGQAGGSMDHQFFLAFVKPTIGISCSSSSRAAIWRRIVGLCRRQLASIRQAPFFCELSSRSRRRIISTVVGRVVSLQGLSVWDAVTGFVGQAAGKNHHTGDIISSCMWLISKPSIPARRFYGQSQQLASSTRTGVFGRLAARGSENNI